MSALINRVPTGRIVSLHAELQYLNWKCSNKPFTLEDMKSDSTLEKNQLDFFRLAIKIDSLGIHNKKYDPYLENPLDKAVFHLTQSIQRDSQKSKAASECFTAFEGLGWIDRLADKKGVINSLGQKVLSLDYLDPQMFDLIRESTLNYGPFVGFLYECFRKSKNGIVKRKEVIIGYTDTHESLTIDNRNIPISTGSKNDSITRTRSAFIAWAITAGYIWPNNLTTPTPNNWHKESLELIKSKSWSWTSFKVFIPEDLFAGDRKLSITRPLTYRWMTKNSGALRERGQAIIRKATMLIDEKLKNRRFALVYTIALLAHMGKKGSIQILLKELSQLPDLFVINPESFDKAMRQELKQMHKTSGLIYKEDDNEILSPVTKCDLKVLEQGVSESLVVTLRSLIEKVIV